MATGRNSKGNKSTGNTAGKTSLADTKKTSRPGKKQTVRQKPVQKTKQEEMISAELSLLVVFAVTILLFLCNFGIIGSVGNAISGFLFGVFGLLAYVVPVFLFLMIAFGISNKGNSVAALKLISVIVLVFIAGIFLHLFQGNMSKTDGYSIAGIYNLGKELKKGGGVLFGSAAFLFYSLFDTIGTCILMLVLTLGCIIIITEKSLLNGMKKGGEFVISSAKDEARQRRERVREKREYQEEIRRKRRKEMEQNQQEKMYEEMKEDAEKILRMDKRVTGVMLDTKLAQRTPASRQIRHDDIHEITIDDLEKIQEEETQKTVSVPAEPAEEIPFVFDQIKVHGVHRIEVEEREACEEESKVYEEEPVYSRKMKEIFSPVQPEEVMYDQTKSEESIQESEGETAVKYDVEYDVGEEAAAERFEEIAPPKARQVRPVAKLQELSEKEQMMKAAGQDVKAVREQERQPQSPYSFPPVSYLKKTENTSNENRMEELKETAVCLQQTLATFGVKVTITDISQGPSVTRYELQPERGVKVSKIVGLTDDIKLNLAATDIRMEAPIPGKAAIGIEVPNKENSAVGLRDLIESKEYKEFPSKLAFAVGKDIAGKVVVADIAKMPHMLIAGSTGSGKSVCINTLIMSILYKATPEEVKMIMIDPKVVELSVYNGIPHLLIPVVTDPKKAAAALHWGVAEMTDRYNKFMEFGVRDLKGYNAEAERRIAANQENAPKKMPQIVIIVDELADLMMVAPGEVEESICRLAQLARAAGIHLIIATQRPSVDVITGLIKANMPSRVSFAVSSGTDSRTILDMNGAEKLLGKGDMLFYPQGYPKPARVQGAFVSDEEVSNIVDFLKNQNIGNIYSEDIEDKIKNMKSTGGGPSSCADADAKDEYFVECAKFIIEKEKASIGMLQRTFKIGFNRAARIMDQLAEAGIVGEEEGTKPRKILMSMEQFEQYAEDYL